VSGKRTCRASAHIVYKNPPKLKAIIMRKKKEGNDQTVPKLQITFRNVIFKPEYKIAPPVSIKSFLNIL
jgi:hypothetical protein